LFNWPNTSSRTVALGSAQPLTEMKSSWGVKGGRSVKLTTSPPSLSWLFRKYGGLDILHNPMDLRGPLTGIALLFLLNYLSTTPWRHIGKWKYNSTILDLSTSWRWVVSFTPRPLYPRGNSPRYPLDRRLGKPQSRSGRRR
jgi:hypothetical protein